jgi:hypothetical protein
MGSAGTGCVCVGCVSVPAPGGVRSFTVTSRSKNSQAQPRKTKRARRTGGPNLGTHDSPQSHSQRPSRETVCPRVRTQWDLHAHSLSILISTKKEKAILGPADQMHLWPPGATRRAVERGRRRKPRCLAGGGGVKCLTFLPRSISEELERD